MSRSSIIIEGVQRGLSTASCTDECTDLVEVWTVCATPLLGTSIEMQVLVAEPKKVEKCEQDILRVSWTHPRMCGASGSDAAAQW